MSRIRVRIRKEREPVSQRIWTLLDLDPPVQIRCLIWTPSADLNPPPKLSENIILNVLVKMDDTLRSSAY